MSGGASATFQYDAFGRRVNKTVGGVSTGFLHDGINPVQEQFTGGVNANLLTSGVDEFFSRTDQLGTQTLLTDALGSTWGLAGPSGTILTQYTYEPFGKSTVSGSTFSPFQFTGRDDDATGLYYYRSRYYSPSLQRFILEDPLEFAAGDVNLYAYVHNDPVNFVDPTGTSAADVQRIQRAFEKSVAELDNLGARRAGTGRINGTLNNIQSSFDRIFGGKKLGCRDQTALVIENLRGLRLDDNWTFEEQSRYVPWPHTWGRALSSNPHDPIVVFDPWKNTFEVNPSLLSLEEWRKRE